MSLFAREEAPACSYWPEPAGWYAMVARNLATWEIAPLGIRRDALTLFDCGANRGLWTRAALEFWRGVTVSAHLFEPSSRNCAFMRDATHGLLWTPEQRPRIHINECAVGKEAGELPIFSDWEGSWLASLAARPGLEPKSAVPVVALDEYAANHGVEVIDLLKLDVEGWEYQALQGAKGLIDRGTVQHILFEFGETMVYSRVFFRDFWEMLSGRYEIFHLNGNTHKLAKVESYSGEWEKFWGTTLYFCRVK